jgi:hypothetical protein
LADRRLFYVPGAGESRALVQAFSAPLPTKGTMSSLDLREIEDCKIKCARKFFAKITSEQVRYDVVDNYTKLMEMVK